MQIVWNQDVVEQLKSSQLVLELETFIVSEKPVTCYCIVPPEKIKSEELSVLDQYIRLHQECVNAYNKKDTKLCEDCIEQLMGKFGGELDTFYEEILKKLKNS